MAKHEADVMERRRLLEETAASLHSCGAVAAAAQLRASLGLKDKVSVRACVWVCSGGSRQRNPSAARR